MKRIFYPICAAGFLMISAPLGAQTSVPAATSPVPPAGPPGQPAQAARPQPVRMQIDFKGGQPDDLIAAMKSASGAQPNVIIHQDAARTLIPAFSLRDVTASQVFTALNMIGEAGESPTWQPVNTQDGEIWTLMPARRQATAIDPLTGLPTGQPGILGRQPVPTRQARVFNLTPVLDDYSVEDATTAMKGAWELMNSAEDPTVKYHKDTKLLIVMGDPNQLSVVSEVLNQLQQNIFAKQRAAAGKAAAESAKQEQPKKQ
jgi:hypothetical protein